MREREAREEPTTERERERERRRDIERERIDRERRERTQPQNASSLYIMVPIAAPAVTGRLQTTACHWDRIEAISFVDHKANNKCLALSIPIVQDPGEGSGQRSWCSLRCVMN